MHHQLPLTVLQTERVPASVEPDNRYFSTKILALNYKLAKETEKSSTQPKTGFITKQKLTDNILN